MLPCKVKKGARRKVGVGVGGGRRQVGGGG